MLGGLFVRKKRKFICSCTSDKIMSWEVGEIQLKWTRVSFWHLKGHEKFKIPQWAAAASLFSQSQPRKHSTSFGKEHLNFFIFASPTFLISPLLDSGGLSFSGGSCRSGGLVFWLLTTCSHVVPSKNTGWLLFWQPESWHAALCSIVGDAQGSTLGNSPHVHPARPGEGFQSPDDCLGGVGSGRTAALWWTRVKHTLWEIVAAVFTVQLW